MYYCCVLKIVLSATIFSSEIPRIFFETMGPSVRLICPSIYSSIHQFIYLFLHTYPSIHHLSFYQAICSPSLHLHLSIHQHIFTLSIHLPISWYIHVYPSIDLSIMYLRLGLCLLLGLFGIRLLLLLLVIVPYAPCRDRRAPRCGALAGGLLEGCGRVGRGKGLLGGRGPTHGALGVGPTPTLLWGMRIKEEISTRNTHMHGKSESHRYKQMETHEQESIWKSWWLFHIHVLVSEYLFAMKSCRWSLKRNYCNIQHIKFYEYRPRRWQISAMIICVYKECQHTLGIINYLKFKSIKLFLRSHGKSYNQLIIISLTPIRQSAYLSSFLLTR